MLDYKSLKKRLDELLEDDTLIDEFIKQEEERSYKFNKSLLRVLESPLLTEENIKKLVDKYNSDEYYFRWANRGMERECALFYTLYYIASEFGVEATEEEYNLRDNMFSSGLYKYKGYWFELMQGQGSVVNVFDQLFS